MLLKHPHLLILDAPPLAEPEAMPERAALAAAHCDARIAFAEDLTPAEFEAALAEAEVILTQTRPLDAALLERAEQCLLVQTYGPGNGPARVDLDAARRLGIYVASLPDYASDFWAEATLAALQRGAEQLGWGPRVLKQKRLGLLGLGQVGRRVAHGARALGLRVFAHDPFCPAEHFPFNDVIPVPSQSELAGLSHMLALLAPVVSRTLSGDLPSGQSAAPTRACVNADLLRLLPRDGLLLNFSAPELVDLDALTASLAQRRPALALFAAPVALKHPQLLAGQMPDPWAPPAALAARMRIGDLLVDFLRGTRPPHLMIDPPCPRHALVYAD
jgi:D-3-phosphoglycerate dehydrogenase